MIPVDAMFFLCVDWNGRRRLIHPNFVERRGRCAEVAPTGVRGGDGAVVLHRYSMRGFKLSRPVKVCACPSERAEAGSRMTHASMPDVTAQLGRLMTEGPGPAHTCPSRLWQATSWGEERKKKRKKKQQPRSMGRCSAEKTATLQGPLSFSPFVR